MSTKELFKDLRNSDLSERMPVVFVGHGNPMNAITDNEYRKVWYELGSRLVRPSAVLCVSAHWLTDGTYVTVSDKPQTIHDFYGFPDELFKVNYPVSGARNYAEETISNVTTTKVLKDSEYGLDHGAWSVLMNMYPDADIPVYQMSIDITKSAEYHFNLAKELSFLRNRGVIVIGSGNVVHNLRMVKWREEAQPYDWALEFDEIVKKSIENDNPSTLTEYEKLGEIGNAAHPTNDHFLPLFYTLGLRKKSDKYKFFNDKIDMGSISMRSVIFY